MIHRCPDGAPCVKHIIDEDNIFALDIFFKLGTVDDRVCPDGREVVAVKRNVDNAVKRGFALEGLDLVAEAFGERDTASANADEIKIFSPLIFLDDLGREPPQRALHTGGVHYP